MCVRCFALGIHANIQAVGSKGVLCEVGPRLTMLDAAGSSQFHPSLQQTHHSTKPNTSANKYRTKQCAAVREREEKI